MTLSTIQPIGNRPLARPSPLARNARSEGMEKPMTATQIAAISAITAAICAFTLPEAISSSSRATGMAATSVDSNSLANGL